MYILLQCTTENIYIYVIACCSYKEVLRVSDYFPYIAKQSKNLNIRKTFFGTELISSGLLCDSQACQHNLRMYARTYLTTFILLLIHYDNIYTKRHLLAPHVYLL